MRGIGSGRTTYASQATTEACRSISIGKLKRAGALTAGWSGRWRWSVGSSEVASIRIKGGRSRIVFIYRSREAGADWEDVVEPVGIEWRPCRFGGERPLFRCPGVVNGIVCGRSVQSLYAGGRYFLCRHCYRLTYSSCREDRADRALRRANGIKMRLGGEPSLCSLFPPRPKGMWRRSYERLSAEVDRLEAEGEVKLELALARLQAADSKSKVRGTTRGPYW